MPIFAQENKTILFFLAEKKSDKIIWFERLWAGRRHRNFPVGEIVYWGDDPIEKKVWPDWPHLHLLWKNCARGHCYIGKNSS